MVSRAGVSRVSNARRRRRDAGPWCYACDVTTKQAILEIVDALSDEDAEILLAYLRQEKSSDYPEEISQGRDSSVEILRDELVRSSASGTLPESVALTQLPISCVVPGIAATLTGDKLVAEPWKRAIAQAVAAEWNGPFIAHPVGVELEFRAPRSVLERTSLHNLLKATIDGLSLPLFAAGKHGHRTDWNREDGWITSLKATKALATDRSVRITVGPASPVPDLNGLEVHGRPAPWATKGELAWKSAIREVADRERVQRPLRTLRAVFSVESKWYLATDLDNLVVPLVSALCGAEPSASTSLEDLWAWKCPAAAGELGVTFVA